ncbi:P-loop containing nucleoside triphosphate hydrolase protein [Mycena galopus ATCC 62051]|nr:P-loop containing nucleoside triphosphate hydrolase protein [Mycena galopus ATCC 62051]
MSRGPCHFYNKAGGCRRGTACGFSHAGSSSGQSGRAADPSPGPRRGPPPKAPSGVCNYYWSTGSCRREFDCKFQHTQNPSLSSSPSPSSASTFLPSTAPNPLAPFLTESGLAKLNGSSTDIFFAPPTRALSPNGIHNMLKKFLRDDFRFSKTFDIYGFLVPMTSIDASGPNWAPEDGPMLLTSLATGNCILRIDDVFGWPLVSSRAGSSSSELSFQRSYVPLLKFYSSEFVIKSTLDHLVNGLYMRIMDNFDNWSSNLDTCMQEIMAAQSFRDPNRVDAPEKAMGSQVISSLAVVFFEILIRFKNAAATYPNLVKIVRSLQKWCETWIAGVSTSPATFEDPFAEAGCTTRDQITSHLRAKVHRLVAIVDREQSKIDRANQPHLTSGLTLADRTHEGVVAALNITYEGPGALRPLGARHDNDHSEIADIRIAPTHEELISPLPPFLPGNFHDAPHPLPAESMERLLDIQFRLLREELTAPLRTSLIKSRGDKYRRHSDGQDQVLFNVYTNVQFFPVVPDWRGLSVELAVDTPPGRARQSKAAARVSFWEGMSGKRLIQGGLVALVWQTGSRVDVHLGIIASGLRELTESARKGNGDARVSVRVVFFDPAVEVRILNIVKNRNSEQTGTKVLVEATVMYEAIRPFLEALRVEPESLPFAQYLVHRRPEFLSALTIAPPRYALVPGFSYQLSSLFPPEVGIDNLKLDVSDPLSVASARARLRTSRLDESQAEAVVATLTRELAMIQGPPGTGKSYTGVEILRVLLANRVRPILMIAFTNHALDHLLTSVLDAGITNKVVRLGSRSADEKISKYSMETIEMVAGKSRLDRSFGQHYRDLKNVQEEIKKLMKTFVDAKVTSEQIQLYLEVQYGEHYEHLYQCPPEWVETLRAAFEGDDSDEDTWMRAGKHGRVEMEDNSMYAYWRRGRDFDFLDISVQHRAEYEQKLENQNRFDPLAAVDSPAVDVDVASETTSEAQSDDDDESSDSDDIEEESWQRDWPSDTHTHTDDRRTAGELSNSVSPILRPEAAASHALPSIQVADLKDPAAFFGGRIPVIPDSDRPLDNLLAEGTMWSFSRRERDRLHGYWSSQVRERLHEDQLLDFQSLRSKHESILKKHQEGKDEIRRQLLSDIDIVGCTTTGAAKLTSLLKSLCPRVMLVEEAGQVLEAHILGSLVPSVEHLILIGDPLQLRPTLNNYALSMDNKRGKELFKFDMSLMERLAVNGLAMSQINVQRRMRPTISTLIRNALYPALQDHKLVKSYSDVRGFSKNVFFFSHSHRENEGGEESASKYNTFEVAMIKDLVLHLLRQGCYSEEGDIVVLCAYLGQLARVRDALGNEVAVIIDGRDKDNLAEQEEELEDDDRAQVERIQVTKRVRRSSFAISQVCIIRRQVRLRTIDNYQGEEAKVVILSTVRNAGSTSDSSDTFRRPTIGFLTSENRTNVALSRAKEGLFILGNAPQLASRSRMWREVIEQLEDVDCVGPAFPIACHRHPDEVKQVSEPGRLVLFAPDGGCLQPCNYRLKCGHVCHYKCHPDDPKHVAISCPQPCRKLCPRQHPCNKECSDDCGKCRFLVRDVELPCGHTVSSIECHRLEDLEDVICTSRVLKDFPGCEHSAEMMCSSNPAEAQCTNICGGVMTCCGRPCNSRCHQCQGVNEEGRISRIKHIDHPCQKVLFCAHTCSKPCSSDHECATECRNQCRQECSHSQCTSYCSSPCSPCMKECTWACPHHKCPLPCGSVCARLPCDQPCLKPLRCGHNCPSVCGEDCTIQTCPICAPDHFKEAVVDFVLYRKLDDIDPSAGTLDELLITLPKCRHVFTVETLDGHCGIGDFYTRDGADGKWLRLHSPDSGGETRKPPVCPTCRQAITSPRYGRVFKSADLEILERNVISRASQSLNKLQTSISGITKSTIIDALKQEAARLRIPSSPSPDKKTRRKRTQARGKALKSPEELPLHAVPSTIATVWKRATQRLSNIYTRSAHINAWEAAFSCLSLADPSRAPRKPEEHAMRMARMKVGLPQPRADKRFLVEAFWVTLTVRFIMGDLATSWMEELIKTAKNFSGDERAKWGSFGLFIFDSCLRDAELAYSIATRSDSRRQMTTCSLLLLRARLERFKFNLRMVRLSNKFQDERPRLLADVVGEMENAGDQITATIQEHVAKLPKDADAWIPDNFSQTAHVILEEWANLEQSVGRDTFYEPVSLDEQMAVVRALNFSHTGHFYQCPQGHVYVITECGGAMQRSNCPECGAAIGGTAHALDAANRPAVEFENMVREAGADRSPWPWAQ